MGLNLDEQQYRASLQNLQERYVWLELLNYQFQTVDELNGVAIGGNISIDANASIRRTGNITLVVKDSSFEVQSGSKIWLDKYIKVWVGIRDLITGDILKTNCGIFIIDAPSYRYDAQTNTLTFNLIDLMAKLTGERNGYLKGIPVQLKAGENIRKAIIDTLALGGFTKYVVEEAPEPKTIPNDLNFNKGSTIFQILEGLKNIYPGYEMFFDTEGTFIYQKIPDGKDAPILIKDDVWDKVVISEDLTTDFREVKNSIEVYGRTHDPQYYSNNVTISGQFITLNIPGVTSYKESIIYGFTLKDIKEDIVNPSIRINNLSYYPLLNFDNKNATIKAGKEETFYCIQFQKVSWYWLGHLQAYGYAEDANPQSPFYVDGTIGKIRLPLFDGEYANCLTDDLAQQRAEYELWKHTNLNNTVTLNIVPIPWLDVNILVERTLARNQEKGQYIIKNVNFGLGASDTGSVKMMKFYSRDIPIKPTDKKTILLLHGDSFKDSSMLGMPLYNNGVTISDKESKFGEKSFYFDGKSNLQFLPYNFSNENFTIDFWEYAESDAGARFSTAIVADTGLILGKNNAVWARTDNDTSWDLINDWKIWNTTVGEWVHWAVVRNGNEVKVYKNGKSQGSHTMNGSLQYVTDNSVLGMSENGTSYFKGYINEFRISLVARWESDFTPPTAPYNG